MIRALLGLLLGAAFVASPAQATEHWRDVWATSVHASPGVSYADQTIRMVVRLRGQGDLVRIKLSNAFGDRPVTFGAATVDTLPVTFGGARSVTVPAGQDVVGDPVELHVKDGDDLAVSVYVPEPTGPATWHRSAVQTNYVATGDHTADRDISAFSTTVRSWVFLNAVTVTHGPARGTLVAAGDSITDGSGTAVDGFQRWPDYLATRLAGHGPAVVNVGIGGNRVLTDTVQDGQSLLNRLTHDVLDREGLSHVILLEGVNDLRGGASAGQLIAAYQEIVARVHERGANIYGGTITPMAGSSRYDATIEGHRQAVNEWIRTGGAFDGVVDFDTALADPADPLRLLPAYDRGDHLHPNAAGFEAMAAAVDLDLLRL